MLSQSGRTTELVDVATWARRCGARTIAITNDAASPLADAADIALVTSAGAELAVPATKTYTAQLAALAVFGAALSRDPDELLAGLQAAGYEAERLLADDHSTEAVAAALADCSAMSSSRGVATRSRRHSRSP